MTLFVISVLVVFLVTGICALVEAALYAVPRPYVRQLMAAGHRSGKLLEQFDNKMDYPISAILIFDTILGVGGAAIAGAQAHALFGADFVVWFSVGLAATLLIVSQIIPKILGVVYSKPVARVSAAPIGMAIRMLFPVVWIIERFTRLLKPDAPLQQASEEEVKQMARLSAEEGSILGVEAELIQNSLELNDVRADQIMTPKEIVVVLPADMTVKEAFLAFPKHVVSRIPIHDPHDEMRWVGVVASRDILAEMAQDHFDVKLADIAESFHCVDREQRGHLLLNEFLQRRASLFGVHDQQGQPIGVVSLSDVVEEIIGENLDYHSEN